MLARADRARRRAGDERGPCGRRLWRPRERPARRRSPDWTSWDDVRLGGGLGAAGRRGEAAARPANPAGLLVEGERSAPRIQDLYGSKVLLPARGAEMFELVGHVGQAGGRRGFCWPVAMLFQALRDRRCRKPLIAASQTEKRACSYHHLLTTSQPASSARCLTNVSFVCLCRKAAQMKVS